MSRAPTQVTAFPSLHVPSLNPLHYLGTAVSKAAADGWESAMIAIFSAAMWLLQLAFHLIDAFTTPDLSATGPLHGILPTTYWVAAALAGILFFAQLALAVFRHDGTSMAKTLIGMAQFGAAWIGFLGFASVVVVAMSGLEHGILSATLHVTSWSQWTTGSSWPKNITDVTIATVLGLGVGGLVIPSAFAYLLLMLVREAGLLVLAATSPISSAGLLSEATRTWFWKMLRWFLAAAAMAPLIALVVGMGVEMTQGVLTSTSTTTNVPTQIGQTVVSACLLAVGAVSPVVLFKLLAFVDPNTASGQAMRSSLDNNGGLSGLLSGSGGGSGSGSDAASQQASDGSGVSAGEAQSDDATSGRLASAMSAATGAASSVGGSVASVMMGAAHAAGAVADKASAFAESGLGGSGVGHGGQGEGGGGNGARPASSGGQESASSSSSTSSDTSPSDPGGTGSDPGRTGSDPGRTGSDPGRTGSEPGGTGSDPAPATTKQPAGTTSHDADTTDQGVSGAGRDGKDGSNGAPGALGPAGAPDTGAPASSSPAAANSGGALGGDGATGGRDAGGSFEPPVSGGAMAA